MLCKICKNEKYFWIFYKKEKKCPPQRFLLSLSAPTFPSKGLREHWIPTVSNPPIQKAFLVWEGLELPVTHTWTVTPDSTIRSLSLLQRSFFCILAKRKRTDNSLMGWGLAFVSTQEFKTRMWCWTAFTDGSLNHIYTKHGLLKVHVEAVWTMGKTDMLHLERFNLVMVVEL